MAEVHQFILNAFNADAIVFMMGNDSDQMGYVRETGNPLDAWSVTQDRAEAIMAMPEVLELTRKARAGEYISIAEFDDTIKAIGKVSGFGSWLLDKGANQVQLRNMLGALDKAIPPSPPVIGRKNAILERSEVSCINPVIIRDESGIEIYLQPYIHIIASGGNKVETVGVALCLHFVDNAAANEFIGTHKYENNELDRRRIGYSTEGERGIQLSEGQIYLEAITCIPDAVDVLFNGLKTAWLDTNFPKLGVNLSDATKEKIRRYYCNAELQEKGEISATATRSAETMPPVSVVEKVVKERQTISGTVASPAATPVSPIRRLNPSGSFSGQTFIVIDDQMDVLVQTYRIISQAGGTVIPITTDNTAICDTSMFKRKPGNVDSRSFLLNVLPELVAANPQAIILSDMTFDPRSGYNGLKLAEDLRASGYPQAFILWTGGSKFTALPEACDAVLDKHDILQVNDSVAAIRISSAAENARQLSLERMRAGGQQHGSAGGQLKG